MAESEVVLLKRFAENGDSAAFSRIVQMHAGLVYGACLRVLDDKERAADAVQETFFQLVKHSGEVTGSVPAWLHRVATRKAIDVVRRDSARRRREAKYAVKRLAETEKWEDISLFVDEAMDELDDETKDVLVRHFFEGKAMSQVGEEVGVSQATVSRRVEAGVAMLRDKLHKRGIIVAVTVLGGLLGQNAAQAAPAAVMAELGKMAMVGGAVAGAGAGSAAASGAAAAGSAAGAGAGTATSAVGAGLLAGVKAKVIVGAAVAVMGVGSVVTYNAVKSNSQRPARPAATSSVRQATPARRASSNRPAPTAPPSRPVTQTAAQGPDAGTGSGATANDNQPVGGSTRTGAATTAQGGAGYGGAGYGMGGYGGGYGGGMVGGAVRRASDSNDSNSVPSGYYERYYGGRKAQPAPPEEEADD